MKIVKISEIKPNPSNPRVIKDHKFAQLKKSLQEFPDMANVRPIVVNKDMVVLGGNMRLKAMKEAGWKEVPVEVVDWPEEKQREFIIKDNVGFGEWDWQLISADWPEAEDWGLDVPQFSDPVDYSILDDEDVSEQLDEMAGGVMKAIQIEFEPEHYEEAFALIKFWRERNAYVGGMIIEYLKSQKEKK
ncbi:MAG: ParB N-terminal domain-containing protein [Flavobacterium sp.]